MNADRGWFFAGLFLTTLATLVLEILDTRLLSVLTWYHLSFFAVSTAMFGMAAGAIRVYLGAGEFAGDRARTQLARYGTLFALAVPLSHVANLSIPIPIVGSASGVASIVLSTLVLAVPFYLSGVVVAICLTRVPGPSGLTYGVDLIGAALGALLVIPLLNTSSVSSAALICGAIGSAGAVCFHRFATTGQARRAAALAALWVLAALANSLTDRGLHPGYAKGQYQDPDKVTQEFWTIHGRVIVGREAKNAFPPYWGAGRGARRYRVNWFPMQIDGIADTALIEWDGEQASLDWLAHDVTSLPYHIRRRGDAAVIGVGGGRDVLTALWGESRSVVGIEVNSAFLHLIGDVFRDYARIAVQPNVTLIHDDARSYLTRTDERFDVLQMSLIDTSAATGAGAFTLSENGLYTLEGWRTFLRTLKPGGILSVSRWYSSAGASETSRLLVLAAASLIDRQVAEPGRHLVLVRAARIATLLLSTSPFTEEDLAALAKASELFGFEFLYRPGEESSNPLLGRIATSRSLLELDAAIAEEPFDYSVPIDERPYFFNILRPSHLLKLDRYGDDHGILWQGNALATLTLVLLWVVTATLVVATIGVPLWRSGLPKLSATSFASALLYFGLIGAGFMLVQIPLMQRFSVYLGHPTYTTAGVLFSMILATGVGSLISDRLAVESQARWVRIIPIGIAVLLLLGTLAIQPVIDATIEQGLVTRFAIVVSITGIMALPMGTCFPIGLRLVRRLSDDALPWMWGVNGAAGVLAAVSAVAISLWSGITTSLYLATAAYALLLFPALALWRHADASAPAWNGSRGDRDSGDGKVT